VVSAWDDGLVSWGCRLIAARARWVDERAATFARHVRGIADGGAATIGYEACTAAYSEGGPALDPDQLAEAFVRELAGAREREARRGMTLVGPHRDDLRIRGMDVATGAWTDLRTYGSGGQQRTAAIALRMIEAETLRENSGDEPIILLDDVFAELDPGRSRRILEWVENEEGGQVILTAPKQTDIEVRGGALPRWTIRDGVVSTL
jgi:DNA replication and repair protein RecF